jgi:hypothetical protein
MRRLTLIKIFAELSAPLDVNVAIDPEPDNSKVVGAPNSIDKEILDDIRILQRHGIKFRVVPRDLVDMLIKFLKRVRLMVLDGVQELCLDFKELSVVSCPSFFQGGRM